MLPLRGRGASSIPGGGTIILHVPGYGQKKKYTKYIGGGHQEDVIRLTDGLDPGNQRFLIPSTVLEMSILTTVPTMGAVPRIQL